MGVAVLSTPGERVLNVRPRGEPPALDRSVSRMFTIQSQKVDIASSYILWFGTFKLCCRCLNRVVIIRLGISHRILGLTRGL